MDYTYKPALDRDGNLIEGIVLRSDGAFIPAVEGNADYQRYLEDKAIEPAPRKRSKAVAAEAVDAGTV